MAGKVALLLWGAQTTQLLVEPPWTPPVLWDRVTLTCQGSGTAGAITWYKDGQRWWEEGPDQFRVTESGTYQCDRPGTGRSPPVNVSNDRLVLQVPARALLEGDTVTLRCRGWQDKPVTWVSFYREEKQLQRFRDGTELSLSPLRLHHSGRYRCRGGVHSEVSGRWKESESAPVSVTVRGVPLSGVSVSVQPPGAQVALGDRLVLSCAVATGTGPLSFSWHRGDSWALLGTGPHLELRHVGDNDSGHYQCRASNGDSVAESVPLNVTVLVPVANATISPGALAQPVSTGDPVTLRCSVQVGSAPVTFTWLRNGTEVARGPLLELGDVHVGHSGTYQCLATNQLGQDGHRVFRALSPELALTVTPRRHWDTAVAAGVAGSLLFLVLLVGVIVGWHWWNRLASRKHQERAPPEPLAPPEDGEVLYTHVTRTKRTQGPTRPAPPQDTQVTYAELPGPHG
ncbi:low affinity immunoglobulin gamma Fc region receptor II-like isoform X3 [Corvus hawaiiensis]|uniref:low affinity immunoglobulin gamma Fc region receptor II-like isoform X3 n=1 Tax=Corvus hawaiiensis TaxID=134902 RepID=UPI0020191939|nr:low affinity immunoglobulin gamma Fc region receptor II-like isoform X3 [Corvus hawaiiensis]